MKQRLDAIRSLLDYFVTCGLQPFNRAAVRNVRCGKTSVLCAKEARQILDCTEVGEQDAIIGLRDRALIGLMVDSFAPLTLPSPGRSRTHSTKGPGLGCG